MESALSNRQFEVWFQPQYNHASGALVGCEALVRWRHPQRGLIPPDDFIPVFEQNGFVYEVDKYVWEEACRSLRKWRDEGRNPLPVSVNISRFDIFISELPDVLVGLVQKYELPIELLRLEITESAFSKFPDQITAIIKKLIAIGFTVEIDDFGSGYSSLNTLKNVPAQILKLDMKFLEGDGNSDRGGNILESIVRMAKWLGMSVIAEGVETKAQADFLMSIGCVYVQGYLYAKPMTAEDYEALAKGHGKEHEMIVLETVDNMDNNRFWDPQSMDTLIFNSYAGGACILEYQSGKVETLRINEKFRKTFWREDAPSGTGEFRMTDCLDDSNWETLVECIRRAIATGQESACETTSCVPRGIDGPLCVRFAVRVIAHTGSRYLLYGSILDMTAQRKAEAELRKTAQQLQAMIDQANGGIFDVPAGDDGAQTVRDADRDGLHANGCRADNSAGAAVTAAEMSALSRLPILLSAIMESTSDLVFAKDNDYRYICSSEAFAKLCGLTSSAEVVGKTDYELFDREMADKFRRDDETLYAGGVSLVDMVEYIPSADGMQHYSCTSKYLLRDADGGVIGLYGAGRDITEYRNTTDRLASLAEAIPGGIATFEVSPAGAHILYFNDGFFSSSGYTREEYAAHAAEDTLFQVLEEDRPAALTFISALLKDGVNRSEGSYRCRIKGGGYRWYSLTGTVSQRNGESVIVNAVKYDITQQQETLERLRESEEGYRLAMEHTGNVVFRFTVADRSLTMTREVAAMRGLPERVVDMPQGMIALGKIAPESEKTYSNFFEEILRGEKNGTMIFNCLMPVGWRYLESRYSTVFNGEGKPSFAIVSFTDVTQRMEQEAIVRKWQQSIESRRPESYSLFCCDLNKNASCGSEAGELMHGVFDGMEAQSFTERVKQYVTQRVAPDDQKRYTAFVNADAMMAAYYRGKRADSMEYREKLPDGTARWLRLTVELVEHPSSNDITAYMLYEDIDEKKQNELKRRREAETDPLTGALNRKAFAEKMNLLLQAKDAGTLFALFMLDLDDFKLINDSFGHAAGDETLVEVGQRLKAALRSADLVGRLGGDEFVVCLCEPPNRSLIGKKAKQICTRLHKSLGLEVHLSASIGVAVCPDDGSDFDTLYHKADIALYHVKAAGRDSFAFYSEEMGGEVLPVRAAREALREGLRQRDALEKDGTAAVEKEKANDALSRDASIAEGEKGSSAAGQGAPIEPW